MISGEEFERRLRRISKMRDLILGLRRSAREAYRQGKIPFEPAWDIRSDPDYWREQLRIKQEDAGNLD